VKANLHQHDVTVLPPKTASKKEVGEFLFFVLGAEKVGCVTEGNEEEVITFLSCVSLGGRGLRKMRGVREWFGRVPEKW
jgi:hypothetical protein